MATHDLAHRFAYHPPQNQDTIEAHQLIRAKAGELAHLIDAVVPDGREKALALTATEESMMWSNAGIARAR